MSGAGRPWRPGQHVLVPPDDGTYAPPSSIAPDPARPRKDADR